MYVSLIRRAGARRVAARNSFPRGVWRGSALCARAKWRQEADQLEAEGLESHFEKHPLHFIRVESADDGATSTILSLAGR